MDEAAQRIGGNPDRQVLIKLLGQAGHDIDVLSGRTFQPVGQRTSTFEPNGLPLVEVPDIHVGSVDPATGVRVIPDPANDQVATVLQLAPFRLPPGKVAPAADGLWFAGQLLAEVTDGGGLSAEHVVRWLGTVPADERIE